MTIHALNMAYSASSYGAYNKKLTQQTKDELEKLGIPYDKNISEKAARALIDAKTIKSNNAQKEDTTDGKSELLKRAIALAKKLGISVNGSENFYEIMAKIEAALKEMATQNQGDITALEQLKSLSYEYSAIQAQVSGSLNFNGTKTLMDSLEVLSQYNKTFLH